MEPVDLLCSHNICQYLQNEVKVKIDVQTEHRSIRFGVFRLSTSTLALAFRCDAQWEINQHPISEELPSKLGEIVVTPLGGRNGTSTAIIQGEEEQASLEESRTCAVEDYWKLPFQEGQRASSEGVGDMLLYVVNDTLVAPNPALFMMVHR